MLEADGLTSPHVALSWFVGDYAMRTWLNDQMAVIRRDRAGVKAQHAGRERPMKAPLPRRPPAPPPATLLSPAVPALKRRQASFDMRIDIADPQALQIDGAADEPDWFRLRRVDPAQPVRGI